MNENYRHEFDLESLFKKHLEQLLKYCKQCCCCLAYKKINCKKKFGC